MTRLTATFLLAGLASLRAHAATTGVRLQPVAQTEATVTPVGGAGGFALSFGLRSLLPLSSPFKTVLRNLNGGEVSGGKGYRFQTSTGFNLEASYGISDSLELALATGYESLETRSQDDSTLAQFETASLRHFPVELIARYRRSGDAKDRWIPEAEVGAGWAFGSLDITSTDVSFAKVSKSVGFMKAHAAIGLGFPWTDELSAHLRIGYGLQMFGSASYKSPKGTIEQSSISGLFARGDLRWAF